ncbi:glycosyltransferase [Ruegeria arenilitoris]|uniref:glycosyltransferase n=1 Tax=Ruegeria arenilitoris TaxID=1173585 RepID=UPI001479D37C|nr:glycosyltransferase [Ruegeria arenilitoris]
MRVAYLTNQYPKVSHTFIRREINELEKQGVEVERFAFRGWDAEITDAQDESEREKTRYTLRDGLWALTRSAMKCASADPGSFWNTLKMALSLSRNSTRAWPYHLIYLAHACQIKLWLDQNPVSHIHAHFGTNPAEVALLLQQLGGPEFSFTIHGMDEADNAPKLAFDKKVGLAQFAVAISAFGRSQLMRHVSPDDWEKIKVIHCGLEDDAFTKVDGIEVVSDPFLLCIGRLSPEKGHLILLDAFVDVLKDHPQARLVLAGDGELRPTIEEKIAQLGIEYAVRITGWISSEQVREEIKRCHTLVQPSLIEGIPVVIMEAMAQARTAISTYVGGIPELVQPDRTGWLVPAGDTLALVTAMSTALSTPEKDRLKMGRLALERVKERHQIGIEVAKLRALYANQG